MVVVLILNDLEYEVVDEKGRLGTDFLVFIVFLGRKRADDDLRISLVLREFRHGIGMNHKSALCQRCA